MIGRQSRIHWIFADVSCVLAPTVYEYESGRESISAEDTLCFGAHRVWIRVRGGYVTFEWNYKPTPIETYRNRADRLCVAGIGSSDFHLADFGFGRLLRLSPLRSNFAECTFTVPTQFESRLYSIFFGRDPFSIGITFYIHHFLYILSKAQHHLYINMVYKWHDLRFIRLYPSIWIFKYLKPLYVEIQCMHSSLTVSN